MAIPGRMATLFCEISAHCPQLKPQRTRPFSLTTAHSPTLKVPAVGCVFIPCSSFHHLTSEPQFLTSLVQEWAALSQPRTKVVTIPSASSFCAWHPVAGILSLCPVAQGPYLTPAPYTLTWLGGRRCSSPLPGVSGGYASHWGCPGQWPWPQH